MPRPDAVAPAPRDSEDPNASLNRNVNIERNKNIESIVIECSKEV
jgi:hypothetical protein